MPKRHNTVERRVLLNKDDCDWFESTYPGGSYSWLCGLLLKSFREVHSKTPEELAKLGAEELKKIIEEEENVSG